MTIDELVRLILFLIVDECDKNPWLSYKSTVSHSIFTKIN